MFIEKLTAKDLARCKEIYASAILSVDDRFYNESQRLVWAAFSSAAEFANFVLDGISFGIWDDNELLGFASATYEGHIKSLYVQPSSQGRGLAKALLVLLMSELGKVAVLTVDASKVSALVFGQLGFSVVCEEVVKRNGIAVERYKMKKLQ